MSRQPHPARVKRTKADGTALYCWRDMPGAAERTGMGPGGKKHLLAFQAHVLDCWERGVTPRLPGEFFADSPAVDAEPASSPSCPTLGEWLGDPGAGKPGDFFTHCRSMATYRKVSYLTLLRRHGAMDLLSKKRLDSVSRSDAALAVDRVMRCASCLRRAHNKKLALSDSELRADKQPFDGACDAHYPELLQRRVSVRGYLGRLSAVWNAAIRAGLVTSNPFAEMPLGQWDEPHSNDDGRVSLTHSEFSALVKAHPPALQVVPVLSAHGMLRRGEMWGLRRCDVPVPPADPEDDPHRITFHLRGTWNVPKNRWVSWGKNPKSTGTPIAVGKWASKVLMTHLRDHMPSSAECEACNDDVGVWRGLTEHNPHDGCGFANEALLVPRTLCRVDKYSVVSRAAQAAANLGHLPFDVTHRVYRSTGATLLVLAGVPIEQVAAMGRWSNTETIRTHYFRLHQNAHEDAVAQLDGLRQLELGEAVHDVPVEAQLAVLRETNRRLQADLDAALALHKQVDSDAVAKPRTGGIATVGLCELSVGSVRRSKWREVGDDAIVEAITLGVSRKEVLEKLGFSTASKNYVRLGKEAKRLGVTLPKLWGSKPAAA